MSFSAFLPRAFGAGACGAAALVLAVPLAAARPAKPAHLSVRAVTMAAYLAQNYTPPEFARWHPSTTRDR